MLKLWATTAFILSVIGLSAQEPEEAVSFSELEKKMLEAEAPLTVFNFWATWCEPCVKELPYFNKLNENEDVQVFLVNLDLKKDLNQLSQFAKKMEINTPILYLDEKDPNSYIEKVNKNWSGAIPATLFVSDLGKTFFHEKAFTEKELNDKVNQYLD